MLRRIALPLALLLFLGGALVNTSSEPTDLEERVQWIERLIDGQEEIFHLRVKHLTANSIWVQNEGNRVKVVPSAVSLAGRDPALDPDRVKALENAIHVMGRATDDNIIELTELEMNLEKTWMAPNVVLSNKAEPKLTFLADDGTVIKRVP